MRLMTPSPSLLNSDSDSHTPSVPLPRRTQPYMSLSLLLFLVLSGVPLRVSPVCRFASILALPWMAVAHSPSIAVESISM